MVIELAVAAVVGLCLGSRWRAPMLVAASFVTLLAGLYGHLESDMRPDALLWPLLAVWLDLAALQLGFVLGAYAADLRIPLRITKALQQRLQPAQRACRNSPASRRDTPSGVSTANAGARSQP